LQHSNGPPKLQPSFGNQNLKCVECAKAIVQALGPNVDAEAIKLRCSDDSDVIQFPSKELRISLSGHHVGVRVGDKVYDNHHPDGIASAHWRAEFVAATDAELNEYRRSINHFFGKILKWQELAKFMCNRRQDA
jgi:Papain fold toxin 2